ncbi:MAG: hypothetical protein P9M14_12110, partial [Candidatus Alcyoniella australis]|nr:hypothetical protein [Candidatus Alcyoniella australis]
PMGVALPLRDALNMLCEQSDLGPLLRGLQIEPEAQWFEATLEQLRPLVETQSFEAAVAAGALPMRPEREVIGHFRNAGFPTPDGRAHLAQGLETASALPAVSDRELLPIVYQRNVMRGELARCKWLAEIAHDTPLLIPAATAARLNIRDGRRLTLKLAGRELQGRAVITQGLAPGCVGLADAVGRKNCGPFAEARPWPAPAELAAKDVDFDVELVWWGRAGNGERVRGMLTIEFDERRGCLVIAPTALELEA